MLRKINDYVWELEQEGKMLVPGKIFASEALIKKIAQDKTLEQVKCVACLPGIIAFSMAMPDAHQGYGMCVGGVAAFDAKKGIISPGAVGYDINCGVRAVRTGLTKKEFLSKRNEIIAELHKKIPSGVGEGSSIKLTDTELTEVLEEGIRWAINKNYATEKDSEHIEDQGCIDGADAQAISPKAKARGRAQLGTLGSGNHFIEVQEVETIMNPKVAEAFGLIEDEVVLMIHCGSRGLGHQTASDYIQAMEKEYGFTHLPDRELVYAPLDSPLGQRYVAAMAAAANFAFVNRQVITHHAREVFKKHFPSAKLELIYDVAHNIAKFEDYVLRGKKKHVCVHRKGATRSLGPGRKEIPSPYRSYGSPIFIPGSMGTASYVLVGTARAKQSFASTAHGAGRMLSRSYASQNFSLKNLQQEMKRKNIVLKTNDLKGALEEAPAAYKDIDEVARVSHNAGLGELVARLRPLAVIKG
jgi:tRNA-splicing ligase RtcB